MHGHVTDFPDTGPMTSADGRRLGSVDQQLRTTSANYRERADLGGGFRTLSGAAGSEAVPSITASETGTGGTTTGAVKTAPTVSAHGVSHMAAHASNATASGPKTATASMTIANRVRDDGLMGVKPTTVPTDEYAGLMSLNLVHQA